MTLPKDKLQQEIYDVLKKYQRPAHFKQENFYYEALSALDGACCQIAIERNPKSQISMSAFLGMNRNTFRKKLYEQDMYWSAKKEIWGNMNEKGVSWKKCA